MDNAAQALLIAGGILLGILTITMLVYMFSNISNMGNAQNLKQEAERLAAWNNEWEAYNKRLLYGTEVLTVINKAEQNNKEYNENDRYKVKIFIQQGNGAELSDAEYKDFVNNTKTSIYTCESLTYNEEGRVSTMTFRFKE